MGFWGLRKEDYSPYLFPIQASVCPFVNIELIISQAPAPSTLPEPGGALREGRNHRATSHGACPAGPAAETSEGQGSDPGWRVGEGASGSRH